MMTPVRWRERRRLADDHKKKTRRDGTAPTRLVDVIAGDPHPSTVIANRQAVRTGSKLKQL
jgi:hypothetical protein